MLRILYAIRKVGLLLVLIGTMTSCKFSEQLLIKSVAYQSMTTTRPDIQGNKPMPSDSQILLTFAIDQEGKIGVIVNNLTDDILTIDQERSFMIDTNGRSISYYDNTVYANTSTDYNFSSQNFSMNLGSLASAFGVGGRLGTLLGGMNVGNSDITGTSQSRTMIMSDEKRINLGPHGSGLMSKVFPITGVGRKALAEVSPACNNLYLKLSPKDSPLKFKICISYSLDNGETFSRLDTDFFVDSMIVETVNGLGNVAEAMRKIMISKPDLLSEPWYLLSICDNIPDKYTNWAYGGTIDRERGNIHDFIVTGLLFNYE